MELSSPGRKQAVDSIWFTKDGTARVRYADEARVVVRLGADETLTADTSTTMPRQRRGENGPVQLCPQPDGSIQILNSSTGIMSGVLVGHNAGVVRTELMKDASIGVSVSDDHTLRVWDISNRRQLAIIVLSGPLTSLARAPGKDELLVGDILGNVYWFSIVGVNAGR